MKGETKITQEKEINKAEKTLLNPYRLRTNKEYKNLKERMNIERCFQPSFLSHQGHDVVV